MSVRTWLETNWALLCYQTAKRSPLLSSGLCCKQTNVLKASLCTLLQCFWAFRRHLNYTNFVYVRRNNNVKQKDNRQPGTLDKSRGTSGKESVTGEQLGRTEIWTIHQERNKGEQFDILDIQMPESGFGWWQQLPSPATVGRCSRAPGRAVWQSAYPSSLPEALLQQEDHRRQGNCNRGC